MLCVCGKNIIQKNRFPGFLAELVALLLPSKWNVSSMLDTPNCIRLAGLIYTCILGGNEIGFVSEYNTVTLGDSRTLISILSILH